MLSQLYHFSFRLLSLNSSFTRHTRQFLGLSNRGYRFSDEGLTDDATELLGLTQDIGRLNRPELGKRKRLRLGELQVSAVVAICDHIGVVSLRELKQQVAGDQRSQNMCEKSSHKHILNLPQKPQLNANLIF
jgi:hypothetical protein